MSNPNQNSLLGSAPVPKLMVKMAVPAVVAQVVNLLYNIVDRIYIGHIPEIGGLALTGVGLFLPINMLMTAFAMLCGAGGAPLAAIELGKNDKDQAEKIMTNSFLLLLVFSVILITTGLLITTAYFISAIVVPLLFFACSPNSS